MILYHYTCGHGRLALGDEGQLLAAADLVDRVMPWPSTVIWLTDLPEPDADRLGLTSQILLCDRTAHRYRVTARRGVATWSLVRRHAPNDVVVDLESAPGADPAHWFVALNPVPAVYDPIPVRSKA